MNYIKLINSFWEIQRKTSEIDSYTISLYFAMLNLANINNWQEVSVYRDDLLKIAKISKTTYYKSRDVLKIAGLIDFKGGANGVAKCTFTVLNTDTHCPINETVEAQTDQSSVPNLGQQRPINETVPSQIKDAHCPINETIHINSNKQVNSKTNKGDVLKNENDFSENETAKIISLPTEKKEAEKKQAAKKEKGFADVIFPFDSPAFKEIWNIWIEYRKQQKLKSYQPIGLQAALTKLSNDANGKESEAIEIIKFSMSKQWQGLYPERKNNISKQPKTDWRNDLETINNFKFH